MTLMSSTCTLISVRPLTRSPINDYLRNYGDTESGENVHAWVKDVLTNRSQLVKIKGASSELVNVKSGVPQGKVSWGLFSF